MEIVPSPQSAQFLVGFDKYFLSYILRVVEVEEFSVGKPVDALLVLVHKEAKGL